MTEFYRNKARPDGLDTRCKACSKDHTYARRAADPEEYNRQAAALRAKNLEKIREQQRQYAKRRRQTPEYKAYFREYVARWLTTEQGKRMNQAKRRRRRAAEAGALGSHTREQLAARVAFYGGLCWVCAAPYEAIDHIIPLTKGGTEWPANLRPICGSCNSRKHNRWPFHPSMIVNSSVS